LQRIYRTCIFDRINLFESQHLSFNHTMGSSMWTTVGGLAAVFGSLSVIESFPMGAESQKIRLHENQIGGSYQESQKQPFFPVFHVRPPAGHVNDPNGKVCGSG
jgi:hypothetical protein